MILKADARGRVQTPRDQREALLDAFEQSGLTGAAFARLHGLRYPTFMSWRQKRIRNATGEAPRFQEVVLASDRGCDHGLIVELPGGGRFVIDRAHQLPMATALLRYLDARR